MTETRKLAAILVSDVVGYSRLTGADEDRILARLRTLRSDLIDPTIAVHHGRVVKRTGDGSIVEFRSVVDAVNCAIEVQRAMVERNAEVAPDKRIEFRIGIHLGDVVEESDGDLMGDGVNIAARLQGVAKPGAICLSEQAYWQVKGRLDLAVSDLGPTQLKNIADPIRVYSLQVGVPAQARAATPVAPSAPKRRLNLGALGLGIAALIIVMSGAWWFLGANRPTAVPTRAPTPVASSAAAPAEAKRLSIVVLPFANLSNDPTQDYFADGVTESLTTDLSRLRGSFVIARNTAFAFKGRNVDAREIGKELGVRYVLEGSVQRDAGRMRVNVQLIDAVTGNHLWADRFDKPAADLFEMQDEIVARLANQLGAELTSAEARRAQQAPNPDSMDLYFQGQARLNRGINPENIAKARGYFERAVALDPDNLDALLGLGRVDYSVGGAHLSDDFDARLAAAETTIAKVLSLRPNDPLAHEIMGGVLNQTNRSAQGIAEFERALALDPNLATAHGDMGLAKIFVGRPEETEAHEKEALRLSPRDSFAWLWLHFTGAAKMALGANEEAVALFRRSIENNRTIPLTHFFLAAALANLGKLEEAQFEAKAGLAVDPGFSIPRLGNGGQADARLLNALRKAGVPEQ
ncbi:MAG TPA: adenylate/guanylate cyclase domain-containing protein [Roseiarcus sp.]|nr:adenylate/guanylate cyclase domain-containing protein [Roseiarcus sp.]